MKKLFKFTMVMLLALSLAGCGGKVMMNKIRKQHPKIC